MKSNTRENAIARSVWVDSHIGLQYKYKSALIRAAENEAEFENAFLNLPATLKDAFVSDVTAEYAFLQESGIVPIPIWDEKYPQKLLHLSHPPLVLYAKGNLSLLEGEAIAVVGSRKIPKDAKMLTKTVAEALSRRFAVVTGIADGADKAAIEGSLSRGKTICVLPLGFGSVEGSADRALVEKVARSGLVLTERAYRTTYDNGAYPMRNRVIAGLSDGVLVTGAAEKSGALITAEYALELGRDVFAFPYSPSVTAGEGCNALIKAGAGLVTSARDIFDAFHYVDYTEREDEDLDETERVIVTAVREEGHLSAEQICEKCAVQLWELLPALSMLELKGKIVRTSDGRYQAV